MTTALWIATVSFAFCAGGLLGGILASGKVADVERENNELWKLLEKTEAKLKQRSHKREVPNDLTPEPNESEGV